MKRLAVMVIVCLTAGSAAADVLPDDGVWRVTLEDGVAAGGGNKPPTHDVALHITVRDAAAEPEALATTGYNAAWHPATVESHAGGKLIVRVDMRPRAEVNTYTGKLEGGFCGGTLRYEIEGGGLEGGSWRGVYEPSTHERITSAHWSPPRPPELSDAEREAEIENGGPAAARGTPAPPRTKNGFEKIGGEPRTGHWSATRSPLPAAVEGFTAPEPGEHPKLLFREADLDRLRAAIDTPEGEALIARLEALCDDPELFWHNNAYKAAAWGLHYQLTGDDARAEQAADACLSLAYTQMPYGQWDGVYKIIAGTALAYDLWYDAWDEATRLEVQLYLERNLREIVELRAGRDPLRLGDDINFANKTPFERGNPHKSAMARAAAGLAALALHGDPVPLKPPMRLDEAPALPPAEGYEPWVGVPVVPFTDNNMPGHWLLNGPFFLKKDRPHPLDALGGPGNARPEPGDALDSSGTRVEWRAFYPQGPTEPRVDPANYTAVSIYPRTSNIYWSKSGYAPAGEIEEDGQWRVFLYTVIRNDRPRIVQALPNRGSEGGHARMWLSGRELKDGDLARLGVGLYPMMLEFRKGSTYSDSAPRLREYTPPLYAADKAGYDQAVAAYARAGEMWPGVEGHLAATAAHVRRWAADEIGPDGYGFAAELGRYGQALEFALPFIQAYRNVRGVDLASDTGLQRVTPMVARMSGARVVHHKYKTGQALPLSHFFGTLLPGHEDEARWVVDRHGWAIGQPHWPLMLLPVVPYGKQPTHPASSFPLYGEHERFGVHHFASTFDESEGHFVGFDRGIGTPGARYHAGNLGIRGLGHPWIGAPDAVDPVSRFLTNGVWVHEVWPTRGGRVIHREAGDDGSGVVSMKVDGYRRGRLLAHDNGKEYLKLAGESPVEWTRSIAVDYSGKCGAPALIVLADTLRHASGQETTWQLRTRVAGDELTLDAKAGTFELRPREGRHTPDARSSLKGTFVMPPLGQTRVQALDTGDRGRPTLRLVVNASDPPRDLRPWERLETGIDELVREGRGEDLPADDAVVRSLREGVLADLAREDAEAANAAGAETVFFVVMTLQDGPAPPVEVIERGGRPVAKVGDVTVRFDGEKVVIE